MDPNLVQLAAAYREAKAQLGEDAVLSADGDSADEEDRSTGANDASGVAEDAHEGLDAGRKPLVNATSAGSAPSTRRADPPAEPPDREALDAAEVQPLDGRSNGLQADIRRGSSGRAGSGRSFIAAEAFNGARPGYAFQTGSHGTGYYRDAAGGGTVSRSRQKAIGVSKPAGDSQDDVPMSLDGSAAVTGGSAERRARRAARKPDADDSDSEDDRKADGRRRGVGTGIGQKAKGDRMALPGRLRKKLARDREKHRSRLA